MMHTDQKTIDSMTADELKELLLKQEEKFRLLEQERDSVIKERDSVVLENDRLHEKMMNMEEQIRLFKAEIFGRKSEKLSKESSQYQFMFDEAEAHIEEQESEAESETTAVKEYRRKKRVRKKIPDHYERIDEELDLPEEDKTCDCGCRKVRIGEEITEKLEVRPPVLFVRRIIRPKYACKSCAESGDEDRKAITIAPLPPQIIPRSYASPSLLAFMFTAKFEDAIPFYRQEKQFERLSIDISRDNASNWAIKAAAACEQLETLLWKEILKAPVIQVDETKVQVLRERNRKNTTLSYMWVFRGGPPEKPIIIYKYHPERTKKIPLLYLSEYKGFLQTDGYASYDELGALPGIIHATCWVHARRYFTKAKKAAKKKSSANKPLALIKKLYKIERTLRAQNLQPEEFKDKRMEQVTPVFEEIKDWLKLVEGTFNPESLIGKAVIYLSNQWNKLIRYIESPYLTPDTNLIENAIRPFAVGRKNWLFSGSPRGAFASAMMYSLIQTAKANGLNPYHYLKYIFEKLPYAKSSSDAELLLPQNLTPKDILPN